MRIVTYIKNAFCTWHWIQWHSFTRTCEDYLAHWICVYFWLSYLLSINISLFQLNWHIFVKILLLLHMVQWSFCVLNCLLILATEPSYLRMSLSFHSLIHHLRVDGLRKWEIVLASTCNLLLLCQIVLLYVIVHNCRQQSNILLSISWSHLLYCIISLHQMLRHEHILVILILNRPLLIHINNLAIVTCSTISLG